MTTMPSPVTKEQTRPNASLPSAPKAADTGTPPPTGLPDLAALADEALAALVEHGQAEMLRRKEKRTADFLQLVAETARTLGLAPARVAAAIAHKSLRPRAASGADGRSNVRPKYWSVSDHSQRWSGRGAPPKWFADHIVSGGKEQDMRIPEGEQ